MGDRTVVKIANLTAALLADREKTPSKHNIVACFSCGRTYVYKGRHAMLSLAHRSPVAPSVGWLELLHLLTAGIACVIPILATHAAEPAIKIDCANCRKEFESLGLRCCSKECERALNERKANEATMAEVGMEAAPKRRCAAPGCDALIPKWKNGRKVSSRVTFCSPKCRIKAHRAAA